MTSESVLEQYLRLKNWRVPAILPVGKPSLSSASRIEPLRVSPVPASINYRKGETA